jgi:hypothetical protein
LAAKGGQFGPFRVQGKAGDRGGQIAVGKSGRDRFPIGLAENQIHRAGSIIANGQPHIAGVEVDGANGDGLGSGGGVARVAIEGRGQKGGGRGRRSVIGINSQLQIGVGGIRVVNLDGRDRHGRGKRNQDVVGVQQGTIAEGTVNGNRGIADDTASLRLDPRGKKGKGSRDQRED